QFFSNTRVVAINRLVQQKDRCRLSPGHRVGVHQETGLLRILLKRAARQNGRLLEQAVPFVIRELRIPKDSTGAPQEKATGTGYFREATALFHQTAQNGLWWWNHLRGGLCAKEVRDAFH